MTSKKLLKLILVVLMLIPFTIVSAKTKTEEIVDNLKDAVKTFDGTVNYENDTIEIEWTTSNSKGTEITFSYNGSVIEYDSGEITNYLEAEEVNNHSIYSIYLMKAALRVNGYTDEQINAFFANDENELNYTRNGIEIRDTGEAKNFTSEDGSITTTVSPRIIRIDVTRANLNTTDEVIVPKETIVQDVINNLKSDENFTTTIYEEKVVAENEVYNNDDSLTIYHTYYWDEYHNALFYCEDGILTYEDEELDDYYAAERALSHHMFATQIIMIALKNNGYTNEQIQEFFANEENVLDYEKNGIELKELGETKKFTSADGSSTIAASPMSIKINFDKANLENGNKIYVIENDGNTVTFEFNQGHNYILNMIDLLTLDPANSETLFGVDSETFTDAINTMTNNAKEYGEVISIFNILIQDGSLNYTSAVSLKIKLTEAMKKYNTLKLLYLDDENNFKVADVKNLTINSETGDVDLNHLSVYALVGSNTETITNTINNPQTGDNIVFYISLLGLSVVSLVGVIIYIKKKKIFD